MATTAEETISVGSSPADIVELHTVTSVSASATAEKNPTLLLLHFWGGSNRTFSRLIEELKADYNIVAPSLRGWGRSTSPHDPDAYHIEDYASDIFDLLVCMEFSSPDLYQRGIVLVGHSMGGKIAQVLLTRPRVALLVRGLVLIAPAPAGSMQLPEEMRDVQVHAYDSEKTAREAVENVLLGASVDENEIVTLAQDAVSGAVEARKAWPSYGMGEDFEAAVGHAVRKWPTGTLRVQIVVGSLDRVENKASVREKTVKMLRLAGAAVDVVVLEGVGHLTPVEAPRQLADNMRVFLGSVV